MNTPPTSTTTRRRFLAQAGIGLAAVSTANLALAQVVPTSPKIRVGVVGCGGRGKWISTIFREHGGYEIVAVADYFEAAVNGFATELNLSREQTFTGLKCCEKMIAKGGLDAIAILSPPYFHPEQAKAAVAAGLHVFLAKPVAVDVPGCQSISATGAAARRQGTVFLVDFQTRTNEFFREAVGRVHAGAIGDICFGESSYHDDRLATKMPPGTPEARLANWVFDQALSGDIIVEQNVHTLDVMSWVMKESPPARCTGTGGRRARLDVGNAWDHFALVYEYPNNVGVTFSSRQYDAHGTPGGILNRMFGTKGTLITAYGGDVLIRGAGDAFYRGGKTTAIYKEGAATNVADFHAQILKKDAANLTLEPSVTSNLVGIMGRMAAYEGRQVTWAEVISNQQRLQPDLSGLQA